MWCAWIIPKPSPSPPCPWKNHPPWNQSLVLKRLGTVDLLYSAFILKALIKHQLFVRCWRRCWKYENSMWCPGEDSWFKLWCWRGHLRVPWIAILKKINPEYSLEGLVLKLKLQHFGHLMWSQLMEKTLMLIKIESRRRRGWQRMGWFDGITNSMDSTYAQSLHLCPTPCNPMDCNPPDLPHPWDSPSKNTGVGCHALLRGLFLTQRSNMGLLHCKWILYHWATREAQNTG